MWVTRRVRVWHKVQSETDSTPRIATVRRRSAPAFRTDRTGFRVRSKGKTCDPTHGRRASGSMFMYSMYVCFTYVTGGHKIGLARLFKTK